MNLLTLDAAAGLVTTYEPSRPVADGSPPRPCPLCGSALVFAGRTELDQCGAPFVPAERWACPSCPTTCTIPAA
jgi:hypothetical protein